MYQTGDLIIYGNSGVCRVEEIGPLKGAGGVSGKRSYYTLAPVYGSGTIYTPVDTEVFMRPLLSQEEVEELIVHLPELEEDIGSTLNLRLLTEQYQAAFESHECEDLLRLIKTVHLKSENSVKQGKRLGLTDQKYRKHAEALVHGEFAAVLGIPYDQVSAYIADRISGQSAARISAAI